MNNDRLYQEPFRPQYHFSPARNWMNDPNGLVYYAGEYHLFFQCNPDGLNWDWRKLHWGHAVSPDLVHWRELPLALHPGAAGATLSGSIVVDSDNTSGFQAGTDAPLIAVFTSGTDGNPQHPWDAFQQQSVAFSRDRGRTWTDYSDNPVIPNPGLADFRDPKVFWHAPSAKWVMVLAAGDRVLFYQSGNLKSWVQVGEFGDHSGAHGGPWECPDLFPLAVDAGTRTRWVLIVSVQRGGTLPRSGTQYFVGHFDGQTFVNDNPPDLTLWLDHGPDNYAGMTWSNIPPIDGRRLFIGWMQGANRGSTRPWRGCMTIPRELKLRTIGGEVRLTQEPVQELTVLRGAPIEWRDEVISAGVNLVAGLDSKQCEIIAQANWDQIRTKPFGFKFHLGNEQVLTVAYDGSCGMVVLDHGSLKYATSDANAVARASAIDQAVLTPYGPGLKLQILVDWSSIEVFAGDGQVAMTACYFAADYDSGPKIYALDGEVPMGRLTCYPLKSTTPTVGRVND